jgi:hypothetical protein
MKTTSKIVPVMIRILVSILVYPFKLVTYEDRMVEH